MKKTLMLNFLFLSISLKNNAQMNVEKTAANKNSNPLLVAVAEPPVKLVKDSLEEEKESSYFTIELSLSNRVFNVRNIGLVSTTTSLNRLVSSPSIVYHHKTGMFFSAGASLLEDDKKGFGANYYSIASGYELPDNKNIDLSVACTHYFVNNYFSSYAPPVQNDFWSSVSYKKSWIKPGLSIGYSTGHYGDVKKVLHLYDSITNNVKSFSLGVSASHEFKWSKILTKADAFIFSPSLRLNTYRGSISFQHNTNSNLANFLNKKGRLPKFENTKFQIESMGCDLNAGYEIGKFTIEPEVYMDYYLQATDAKRLSSFVTLNIKYSLH